MFVWGIAVVITNQDSEAQKEERKNNVALGFPYKDEKKRKQL